MMLRCCEKSILLSSSQLQSPNPGNLEAHLSEILPNVCLPEAHNARRVESSCLSGRTRCHTETLVLYEILSFCNYNELTDQWHVIHP